MKAIEIQEIYNYCGVTVIDVRTPAEYEIGHIQGAINIPIFTDDERARVGTRYHQSGHEAGFLLGLELVGPNLAGFVKKLHSFVPSKNKLILYCWRGGMRSNSMAWLFEQAGYEVMIITGGYKAYRQFIREQICNGWDYRIIGGFTGSGKTETLHSLHSAGEQVIDLEFLASHKGSVFGHLGQSIQPNNEDFENKLWDCIRILDPSRPVFLEDESRSIGRVSLPDPFFLRMQSSHFYLLEVSLTERVKRLVAEYGCFSKDDLIANINKIAKYTGSENCNIAVDMVNEGNLTGAAELLLRYYDKKYSEAIAKFSNNRKITKLTGKGDDPEYNSTLIKQLK